MMEHLLARLGGFVRAAAFFGLALVSAASATEISMSINGRPVDVYLPAGFAGHPAPLLLVLHGGLGSADEFKKKIPMFGEADRGGFVVAYLNGTIAGRERANRRTWNSGFCCGQAVMQNVDDVGFIAQVISVLAARGYADPWRVYLMGHSNGAMMSYRFACERPDLIRGVVGFSGTLTIDRCGNAGGVRILMVQGTDDTVVPVAGGGKGDLVADRPFIPMDQTIGMLRVAGASVQVQILTGAGHKVSTLDNAARSQLGISLPQLVGRFVTGF